MKFHLYPLHVVLILLLVSCGAKQNSTNHSDSVLTERTAVLPQNSSERQILEKVPTSKVGEAVSIGGTTFLVTNEYFAASGRDCKSVRISRSKQDPPVHKTICEFDGDWEYTPNVLPAFVRQ